MILLRDAIADGVHALRMVTPGQWILRGVCAGSLVGAASLCLAWFPVLAQELLLGVAVLATLWTVVRPESWAPLVGIGTVALWWLVAARDAAWWQTIAVAGLLAFFHLLAAACAAAPSYAAVGRRAAASLLGRGFGFLAASSGAIALVLGAAAVPDGLLPRGLGWIASALAAVIAATVFALRGSASSSE